jgi:hypothetical protein
MLTWPNILVYYKWKKCQLAFVGRIIWPENLESLKKHNKLRFLRQFFLDVLQYSNALAIKSKINWKLNSFSIPGFSTTGFSIPKVNWLQCFLFLPSGVWFVAPRHSAYRHIEWRHTPLQKNTTLSTVSLSLMTIDAYAVICTECHIEI